MHTIRYAIPADRLPEDMSEIEQRRFGWSGHISRQVNELLSRVNHDQVLQFLEQHPDWESESIHEGRSLKLTGPDDDEGAPIELIHPADDHFHDYRMRLEELLDGLSIIHQRPVAEIVEEISKIAA